jgi:type IV pilus assembly protein PilQ
MMSANIVIRRMGRSRTAALGLCAWLLCSALPAYAANVLQQVSQAPGAKGGVDITFQFAEPVGDAQVFTTDNPPRIAIDLPDTRDGMPARPIPIGNGSASSVSAVEANGRTRVVVDLFRPATYESRIEGNRLVLSVAGSPMMVQAATRKGQGPILANTADPSRRVAGALTVSNIDFRRGANGAGRVVLRFTGEGAAADMHTEGTKVLVDVGNAMMPTNLSKHMDVSDFATPVQSLDADAHSGGSRLIINTTGAFESMAYQTGNEYVVEINQKKAGSDTMVNDANRIGGGPAKVAYKGKPATFNFQDVPVRTVLQLIAEESNLNIVASDTVGGNVTLRLINVPWDQALDIVLRAKSLDKRQDGGVIWIAPQKELAEYEQATQDARIALEQRVDTVTEYIPINYGDAIAIAKLLTDDAKGGSGAAAGGSGAGSQRGFLSPRGTISADTRTNTLLVTDIPKKVAEIKQVILLLDRPVDQVLIEARIVIANQTFARDLGARLGLSGEHHGDSSLTTYGGNLESTLTTQQSVTAADIANNNSIVNTNLANQALQTAYSAAVAAAIAAGKDPATVPKPVLGVPTFTIPRITRGLNVNLPVANPSGSLAFTILNAGHMLDLELTAMQTEGKGEIISNPRVVTSNQKEAIIEQGDEVGYVTSTGGGTTGGVSTPSVQFKDVVLKLKVTPIITQDNRVFLTLEVIKDDIKGFIDTSIGSVPQISKRHLTTAVLIDSGQTVVVGGVYEFKSQEDLNKVPFLGDLPGLGNLFRSKNRSSDKAEMLIFITPKILQVKQRSG